MRYISKHEADVYLDKRKRKNRESKIKKAKREDKRPLFFNCGPRWSSLLQWQPSPTPLHESVLYSSSRKSRGDVSRRKWAPNEETGDDLKQAVCLPAAAEEMKSGKQNSTDGLRKLKNTESTCTLKTSSGHERKRTASSCNVN